MSKKRQKPSVSAAPDNTIPFERTSSRSGPIIIPKNRVQEEYLSLLADPDKKVVFAAGVAGSGKTLLAMVAGIQGLRNGTFKRLILTRPAIGVDGESHGYLPGDLTSKMMPWTQPLIDVLRESYDMPQIEQMIQEQTIELAALAFLRGRSFKNCFIVLDEAQNTSVNQMKMLLTRLGEGCKVVVTGDLEQLDKPFVKDNGFRDFIDRIPERDNMIAKVEFDQRHVVRSAICARILELYDAPIVK